MDSHSTGLIIALIVLIVLSAYFSATETAFSSLNRIRLKNLADNGNKRAKLAYKLVDNYDELISSVLVGKQHRQHQCVFSRHRFVYQSIRRQRFPFPPSP